MDLQQFHDSYTIRVKYAISNEDDLTQYESNSINYSSLWDGLPEGWKTIEEGQVNPNKIHRRLHNARLISTPVGDLLAVEHETGLELLIIVLEIASEMGALEIVSEIGLTKIASDIGLDVIKISIANSIVQFYQEWRSNRRQQLNLNQVSQQSEETSKPSGKDSIVIERRKQESNGTIIRKITTIPAHLVTSKKIANLLKDDESTAKK